MATRPTLNIDQVTPQQAGWDATVNAATGQLAAFVSSQPFATVVCTIAAGPSQLPAASLNQFTICMVSDAASGKCPDVRSNGTNWLYSDGTIAL